MPVSLAVRNSITPSFGKDVIDLYIDRMTVREKIYQMFIMFSHFVDRDYGGIIFMGYHFQQKRIKEEKRYILEHTKKIPPLFFCDQEGGAVDRLRILYDTRFYSAKRLREMSTNVWYEEGKRTGKYLKMTGVSGIFGPVLDVGYDTSNMEKLGRSYGTTAGEVKRVVTHFIKGLKDAFPEIILIGKHYPGYSAPVNTDHKPFLDTSPKSEVMRRAAIFFDKDVACMLDGYMVNNIQYREFDDTFGIYSTNLVRILRAHHPDKVIMTDDLVNAKGLYSPRAKLIWNRRFSKSKDGKRAYEIYTNELRGIVQNAFFSGCDMFILCDYAVTNTVEEAILDIVTNDDALALDLDRRVKRILALKERHGIISFTVDTNTHARTPVGVTRVTLSHLKHGHRRSLSARP